MPQKSGYEGTVNRNVGSAKSQTPRIQEKSGSGKSQRGQEAPVKFTTKG